MNCRRVVVSVLLSLTILTWHSVTILADEPLTLKLEPRHGPNGPAKSTTILPGDSVDYAICIRGLKADEHGNFRVTFQEELRNSKGDIVGLRTSPEIGGAPVLASNVCRLGSIVKTPLDALPGKLRVVVKVRDLIGSAEVQESLELNVGEAEGPYPIHVVYSLDQGKSTASGRFTTGEKVSVCFHVPNVVGGKKLTHKLNFIESGKSETSQTKSASKPIPEGWDSRKPISAFLVFTADKPFEGKIRLTIEDEEGHSNSMEMPILIQESLGADEQPQKVAELPATKAPATKKK